VTDIGLAVNRTWFDKQSNQKKEDTTFVDITVWGRQAEICGEYLSKGRSVLIEGRLQLDQWDDKDSGQKRSKLKVVCENLTMLGGGGSGGPGGGSRGSDHGEPQGGPADSDPSQAYYSDEPSGGGPSDNVPF
jgi:single-strand DNA-binding protein